MASILNFLMGSPSLPAPQGEYSIGSTVLHWFEEESKKESYFIDKVIALDGTSPVRVTETNQSSHGLLVHAWFPIGLKSEMSHFYDPKTQLPKPSTLLDKQDEESIHPASYLAFKDHMLPSLRSLVKPLPNFIADYVFQLQPFSFDKPNGPIFIPTAYTKLPIIIFSHGLYGEPEFYTNYCESLASFGFLVLAPYHTDHSASIVYYPNSKSVIEFGEAPLKASEPDQEKLRIDYELRNFQLRQRVNNVRLVLDTLQLICQTDTCTAQGATWLKNTFDLNSVFMLGHSYGAVTTLYTILSEQKYHTKRIKAGISLDGWFFPVRDAQYDVILQQNPLATPFFFLNSDLWQWKANLNRMHEFAAQGLETNTTILLGSMEGTLHQNFCDTSVWLPRLLKMSNKIGPCDPMKCLVDQNRLIATFFKECLQQNEMQNNSLLRSFVYTTKLNEEWFTDKDHIQEKQDIAPPSRETKETEEKQIESMEPFSAGTELPNEILYSTKKIASK